MNAADALEAIIEFHFTGAFPEPGAAARELRGIMVRFRRATWWPEKFAPLDRTRAARFEAVPRWTSLNIYRAKQLWFQIRFDPDGVSAVQPVPLCEAVYRALRDGGEIHVLLFDAPRGPRGRPRGSTSRAIAEVIRFPAPSIQLKRVA